MCYKALCLLPQRLCSTARYTNASIEIPSSCFFSILVVLQLMSAWWSILCCCSGPRTRLRLQRGGATGKRYHSDADSGLEDDDMEEKQSPGPRKRRAAASKTKEKKKVGLCAGCQSALVWGSACELRL
jgi:hypothetical protein